MSNLSKNLRRSWAGFRAASGGAKPQRAAARGDPLRVDLQEASVPSAIVVWRSAAVESVRTMRETATGDTRRDLPHPSLEL